MGPPSPTCTGTRQRRQRSPKPGLRRSWKQLAAFLSFAAVGCAPPPAPTTPAPWAEYDCGGVPVRVEFRGAAAVPRLGRDSARVTLPDTTLALPLARSASGARYSDGVSTAWEHQGRLFVEIPGVVLASDCPRREVRPPAH